MTDQEHYEKIHGTPGFSFEREQAHFTGKTIAVDFDGVLHSYRKPIELDEQHLVKDPPVEGALEWINEILKHFNVVVYTARHVSPGGIEAAKEWLKKWGFPDLPVTGVKPVARLYVDDRSYMFTGKNYPTIDYLLGYQPWNRIDSVEMWMDIEGYEGYYQVSSEGRVRGLDREGIDGRQLTGKILKPQQYSNGYWKVSLYKEGIVKDYSISRLVAQAFIANPLNKPEVNHRNGDKDNNTMGNLEWVTSEENPQHRYKTGLQLSVPILKGEENPAAKLTVDDVICIKRELSKRIRGTTQRLADQFNVSYATISHIKLNKTWSHINVGWERE